MSVTGIRRQATLVGSIAVLALWLACVPPTAAAAGGPAAARAAAADAPAETGLRPLAELIVQRLQISDQVAAAKFGTGQPIDDPVREQQELTAVARRAGELGLDVPSTVRFFSDQIAASKVVQKGLFRHWTQDPASAPTSRPDLGVIRAQLDQLTTELLGQLVATEQLRDHQPLCTADLLAAGVAEELTHRLDAVHRHAFAVAARSVCVV
jgi:chorismate mutase